MLWPAVELMLVVLVVLVVATPSGGIIGMKAHEVASQPRKTSIPKTHPPIMTFQITTYKPLTGMRESPAQTLPRQFGLLYQISFVFTASNGHFASR